MRRAVMEKEDMEKEIVKLKNQLEVRTGDKYD